MIDSVHAGNLAAASRVTGLPYGTVRDLYAGRTANPALATLNRLREPYGIGLNWFLDREADAEVPVAGRAVLLPPHPRASGTRALREVFVPYAARTFSEVLAGMEAWLNRQPAGPDRPVVGEATGDTLVFRLTTFLLQPLLAAEKLGEEVIPGGAAGSPLGQSDPEWVSRLDHLGALWRKLLGRPLEGK